MPNQKTNIALTQRKVFVGPDASPTLYVVQNKVTAAYPSILGFPFLVQLAGPPYYEVLVKVASFDDINTTFPYQAAALNKFTSRTGEIDPSLIDFTQNPVLRLYNYPAEWGLTQDGGGVDPFTGLSMTPYKNFPIASMNTQWDDQPTFSFTSSFISKYQPNPGGFSFEVYDDAHTSSPLLSGSNGIIVRDTEGNGLVVPFFTDQWMATNDTSQGALSHIASVQASIASLVRAAAQTGSGYLAQQPGNPINTNFTG